jgi:hypothetical protein
VRLAQWIIRRNLPWEGREQGSALRIFTSLLDKVADVVPWPGWQERPELVGVFRSVLALRALRWPHPGKQDSPELVGLRDRLGRQVVGALWRTVEVDAADPGNVAGVARQVAVAVTTQAPGGPGGPGRYSGVDRKLTAGVARAFIDQTLTAVRKAEGADTPLVWAVEDLHREMARTMTGLRASRSRNGPQRATWQTLLSDFVCGVDDADPQVWWHLRHRLLAGAGGPSGRAEPELLPDNPDDWLDLADWPELADVLERDGLRDLANQVNQPMTEPGLGWQGGPEPSHAREPDLDQRGPDPAWLRRLVPDSPPSSAPGMAWGGSRKRSRAQGHRPDDARHAGEAHP